VKSVIASHDDPISSHHSKVSSTSKLTDVYNDNNKSTHHNTTTTRKMKHCNICESDGVTLRVSPKSHERKHGESERACEQCWEAHLSLQVEEKSKSDEIECMFRTSEISEADFKSLAREGTKYR